MPLWYFGAANCFKILIEVNSVVHLLCFTFYKYKIKDIFNLSYKKRAVS